MRLGSPIAPLPQPFDTTEIDVVGCNWITKINYQAHPLLASASRFYCLPGLAIYCGKEITLV